MDRFDLVDGQVFKAAPARSPKVTVMDEYCRPMAAAKVYARQHFGLMTRDLAVGVTDASGNLVVPDLYKGGVYTLRAVLPGYYTWGTRCPAVGCENWIDSIEITMGPATESVKGKVVDKAGKPVAEAVITTEFGPSATTDSAGAFVLNQMPSPKVLLTARKGKLTGTNLDAKGMLTRPSVIVLK